MAVLLRPVDGGSLIKVPTDEVKIIGRGSFLKVLLSKIHIIISQIIINSKVNS